MGAGWLARLENEFGWEQVGWGFGEGVGMGAGGLARWVKEFEWEQVGCTEGRGASSWEWWS